MGSEILKVEEILSNFVHFSKISEKFEKYFEIDFKFTTRDSVKPAEKIIWRNFSDRCC